MAEVGDLKRICKDACRVASAVQETCSSEMLGGPGADFLKEVVSGASDLQVEDDFPRLGGTISYLVLLLGKHRDFHHAV